MAILDFKLAYSMTPT